MTSTKPDISDEAIRAKAGRGWAEWVKIIDGFGGATMTHKDIARKLYDDKLVESGWWCQAVTVGYEKIKGRRVLGQTADAGFEVGVHKTIHRPSAEVWELLLSPPGLKVWLGNVPELVLAPKQPYQTADGTSGEVRTFKDGEMIRLTWQPPGRKEPATVQVRAAATGSGKTRLSFHTEKLLDTTDRERAYKHWKAVAQELDKLASDA